MTNDAITTRPNPARRGAVSWDGLPPFRRDAEDHRGGLLLFLATASMVCGFLSWCVCVSSLLGLPLGLTAFVLAGRDLRKMRAGLMDPRGAGTTERALSRAIDGIVLSLPFWLWWTAGLVYLSLGP